MPELNNRQLWWYLGANVLEQSTLSETELIPEPFNWLQEVQKWRDFYREQSLSRWSGSQMRSGSHLLIPVRSAPERLSRRLKRLNRQAAESKMLYWLDEPFDWNKLYKTGESLKIENRYGLPSLPKVPGVRSKRRRRRT